MTPSSLSTGCWLPGRRSYWLKGPATVDGRPSDARRRSSSPEKTSTAPRVRQLARELSLSFEAVASAPAGERLKLRPVRIGLWDRYGGSMPSGWLRWLLEQFEFPFEVVYAAAARQRQAFRTLRRPDLPDRCNSPATRRRCGRRPRGLRTSRTVRTCPAEFQRRLGAVTLGGDDPGTAQIRRGRRDAAGHRELDGGRIRFQAPASPTPSPRSCRAARRASCRGRSSTFRGPSCAPASTTPVRSPTAWASTSTSSSTTAPFSA